jgi:hypothetical protein
LACSDRLNFARKRGGLQLILKISYIFEYIEN